MAVPNTGVSPLRPSASGRDDRVLGAASGRDDRVLGGASGRDDRVLGGASGRDVSSGCGAVEFALEEAAGELAFEDDDREGVAEDVVEVAGDSFALGDGGEGFDLLLLHAEFAVGLQLLGEEDVAAADDEDEEDRGKPAYGGDAESVRFDVDDQGRGGEATQGDGRGRYREREGKQRGGVDAEAGSAGVQGVGGKSHQEHGRREDEASAGAVGVQKDTVEDDEEGDDRDALEPEKKAVAVHGLDEKEEGVSEPDVVDRADAGGGAVGGFAEHGRLRVECMSVGSRK